VAVKFQLACFERLGAAGYEVLADLADRAREAGLLIVADGKRGDVPVSAEVYGEALFGPSPALDADAATASPLIGADALDPLVAAAEETGAGLFVLVRTSNPGASDFFDLPTPDAPLHERIAELVAGRADRLRGSMGLSGMGAVVGATEPEHLGRLRELMPSAIFLIPGLGAQGGEPARLAPALGEHPASILAPASRSIANAPDPGAAAEALRTALWSLTEA
jgi:orotidine-5'-phosphate decarboxylase